jgi:hypothetical protein
MSIKDYHNLELEPYVADELVKKQYKYLALKYHPDKNDSPEATEKFKLISQSYNNITNKQAQHDDVSNTNIIISNHFFNLFSSMSMAERNIEINSEPILFNNSYTSTSIKVVNGMKITKTTQVINGIVKTNTTITQI